MRNTFVPFMKRFSKNRAGVIGAIVLVVIVIAAVFAPILAPYDPTTQSLANRLQPPSSEHLLGTDELGRDQLSRVMHGGRASLTVGLGAMVLSVAVGLLVGLAAGFFGGLLDTILMRLTDGIMAFPVFFLLIAITAITGPSIVNVTVIIGLTTWPVIARLVRGEVLSLREREYVLAAKISGATAGQIMRRHLIPNVTPSLIVASTLQVAFAVLTEATLSFLGLGVRPPTPSWGNMLTIAQVNMFIEPWVIAAPAAAVILAVLCLNFVGDGLRESLDARLQTQ